MPKNAATARHLNDSTQPPACNVGPSVGVRGWLLVLCLMLTVVGPLISAGLWVHQVDLAMAHIQKPHGLPAALLISTLIELGSVVFGMYAGYQLWRIQPGALSTGKKALLLGLAADVIAGVLQAAAGPAVWLDSALLNGVTASLMPSLIFFTLGFGYLNKSARVQAIYSR